MAEGVKPAPATGAMRPDVMIPRVMRVRHVRRETADTFTMDLEGEDGQPAPPFEPGQFNMLYAYGVGEAAISISGDPGETDCVRHTTRRVGVVTRALGELKAGEVLGVRGPFGTPWPVAAAAGMDVVLVAGGIGLAPLRPALYAIAGQRSRYGKVVLLYGARTPDDILYRKEIEAWRSRLDFEVYVTVDHALETWRGNVGVVTRLIPRAPFDPLSAVAMVCGPEVMMKYTVMALRKRGVADDRIHVSMERNMKCAVGFCGHCQFGGAFVCRDGPVFAYEDVQALLDVREV